MRNTDVWEQRVWLREGLVRLPAASGEALMVWGTSADDNAVMRGDSMGGGPTLQEQSRDMMLGKIVVRIRMLRAGIIIPDKQHRMVRPVGGVGNVVDGETREGRCGGESGENGLHCLLKVVKKQRRPRCEQAQQPEELRRLEAVFLIAMQ
jgi:hypothetical protein